jgi:hypothetical protein
MLFNYVTASNDTAIVQRALPFAEVRTLPPSLLLTHPAHSHACPPRPNCNSGPTSTPSTSRLLTRIRRAAVHYSVDINMALRPEVNLHLSVVYYALFPTSLPFF